MSLKEFFDEAAADAAIMFLQGGELLPTWLAIDGDDGRIMIATPWSDDHEKDIAARMLRILFRANCVKRYAFICEAWTVVARTDSLDEVRKGPMPSEHPDRREVLMISAEDRDGNSLSGVFYILRPEHGAVALSPLEMSEYTGMKGRFVGMLR